MSTIRLLTLVVLLPCIALVAWLTGTCLVARPTRSQTVKSGTLEAGESTRMRLSLPLWIPPDPAFNLRGGWASVDNRNRLTVYMQLEHTTSGATIEQITTADSFNAPPENERLLEQLKTGEHKWIIENIGDHTRGYLKLGRACILFMSSDGAKGKDAIARICRLYERRYNQVRTIIQRDAATAQKQHPALPLKERDWFAASGGMFIDVYEPFGTAR